MKNSRKAFTVIEFIFIIVMLGILSSVILPKLATTRDDAKVAFCTKDIALFMRDLSTYYTSQGKFSLDMREMTNTEVYETTPITFNGSGGEYYYVCNKIKENMNASAAAITFTFSNVANSQGNIEVNFNATVDSTIQGTVDGDLGNLLKIKNIASDGLGITHYITGIRVKR